MTAKREKLLRGSLGERDPDARKSSSAYTSPARSRPIRCNGLFAATIGGKSVVVEYEPDTALRDTENRASARTGRDRGVHAREVLPYAPDAWIDAEKTADRL